MNQRFTIILFSLTVGLLQLTGCGSRETTTPTLADEMRGAAAEVQVEADRRAQLAEDWEHGQSLITSGQRKMNRGEQRIESAERDLERARREIEEGQAELREGRRLVAESERLFEELSRQETLLPQPPAR
jgi:septal ring factor EnvC (AmiA/AmiB activator)